MFGQAKKEKIAQLNQRIAELEIRVPVAEGIFATIAALVLNSVGSLHRDRILQELRRSTFVQVTSKSIAINAQDIGLRAEERAQSLLDDIERIARAK